MMRRALPAAWILAALVVSRAGAHPMGTISISHYAGIEVRTDSVRVKYLLDFAEIPSVRELELVDPNRDDRVTPEEREAYLVLKTKEILPRLRLVLNGRPLALASTWSRVTFPPGEGGLSTVRIAWEISSAWNGPLRERNLLVWNDSNYEDRAGWKEIRFRGLDDLTFARTSLRDRPTSTELEAYPERSLLDPPTDTKAWGLFGAGLTADDARDFETPEGFDRPRPRDRFVALIEAQNLSPSVIAVSLLLAALLGAGHALEPGHGKTIVAAYLVGSRGTAWQAVLLGLTVTFTHTFSVLLLGVLVLFLSRHLLPEALLPWLGFASGLLIAAVGVMMLRQRWRDMRAPASVDAPSADVPHTHGPFSAPHTHAPANRASLASLLALGVSGGLVPCPAGIIVLLAAVGLGRTAFGLLLIVAFSIGLAAVLVGIGLLCVSARRIFDRLPMSRRFVGRLGVASALVVTVFGVALAAKSLIGAPG
jgi:ABC-type nickel/cobalt efflux system permease component RcnA